MPTLLAILLHSGVLVGQPLLSDGPAIRVPLQVQADNAAGVLTRSRIDRANRSRELDDDRLVRDELLVYGDLMSWSRSVEVACLAQALELNTVDPEMADWQIRTARRLSRLSPRHEAVSPKRMAGYGENWYRAASSGQKPAAGEARIEALLAAAALAERRGEMTQGIELLRDAMRVARDIDSPYEKILELEQRRLTGLSRYQQQLDSLGRQLERRADNRTATQAAIRFAIERQDFAKALSFAELVSEPELTQTLTLAAADIDTIEPSEAFALSEWFLDQAKGQALTNDHARLLACYEARFYVHEFLDRYAKRDVLRLRAQQVADELHLRIAELEPEPLRRPAGAWVDLISAVTPPRANLPGSLVRGQHLRVRNSTLYLNASAAAIPAQVPSAYDLRFTVNRTHAHDRAGMSIYFPLSQGGGLLQLGSGGEDSCRLENAEVAHDLKNFRFPEDTRVSFFLSVRESGHGQATVTLLAEGREVIAWTGPAGQLRAGDAPPTRIGRGIVVSCGTSYEITGLAYRRSAAQ
ncbi:MAG: hypothetical protein AAGC44_06435 [Planctomycetota bacterium]